MIRVTIERIETVWKKSMKYQRLHDGPDPQGMYGYVEADLPEEETVKLLEQNLQTINLERVIKAINGLADSGRSTRRSANGSVAARRRVIQKASTVRG